MINGRKNVKKNGVIKKKGKKRGIEVDRERKISGY
jgi:hypothetical protein